MVCLGNICRSPLAEGVLRHKIEQHKLVAHVESCGTGDYHVGDAADSRSVAVAQKNNIDISRHVGRQFAISDFDDFDLIYTMDSHNHRNILSLARDEKDRAKVKMLMDEVLPGQHIEVPDPYYGGPNGFDNVYRMIDRACDKIVEKMER
jgi:protein-tyrosine phosphatase